MGFYPNLFSMSGHGPAMLASARLYLDSFYPRAQKETGPKFGPCLFSKYFSNVIYLTYRLTLVFLTHGGDLTYLLIQLMKPKPHTRTGSCGNQLSIKPPQIPSVVYLWKALRPFLSLNWKTYALDFFCTLEKTRIKACAFEFR